VSAALFSIAFVLVPIEVRGGRALLAAASTEEDGAILDRALRSAFFEPAPLPDEARGPPAVALRRLEEYVSEAHRRGGELAEERDALAASLSGELADLHARLGAAAVACEAMRRFPSRGEVYLIAGWVPARALAQLSRQVRVAATGPVVLEAVPPGRSRRGIPTLLSTPGWLRPFELLVRTFGLSGYRELDPTLVAAVTFLVMYGMMFGDLGHGLLLAAAGALWYARSRAPLAQVVIAAGLSGALFGVLYGTAFGAGLFPPLWLRPLESIFSLLLAAIAAGVVVLNLGFVLNIITRARARDFAGMLLDKSGVLGLALYWTLLGGGLAVALRGAPVALVAVPALVLGALLWLREPITARLEGERPGPWSETLVTGFFELFEAVLGYASNSLSFVRLGAFAVAHEGLSAMVLRYGGGSGGWLVVLGGTLLIVGFEGLVVGIQALRLEYFEFFGRFFRGDGTPFVPLSFQGGQDARVAYRI
jgi:V/A-type H+-transporting ATPase subunit I